MLLISKTIYFETRDTVRRFSIQWKGNRSLQLMENGMNSYFDLIVLKWNIFQINLIVADHKLWNTLTSDHFPLKLPLTVISVTIWIDNDRQWSPFSQRTTIKLISFFKISSWAKLRRSQKPFNSSHSNPAPHRWESTISQNWKKKREKKWVEWCYEAWFHFRAKDDEVMFNNHFQTVRKMPRMSNRSVVETNLTHECHWFSHRMTKKKKLFFESHMESEVILAWTWATSSTYFANPLVLTGGSISHHPLIMKIDLGFEFSLWMDRNIPAESQVLLWLVRTSLVLKESSHLMWWDSWDFLNQTITSQASLSSTFGWFQCSIIVKRPFNNRNHWKVISVIKWPFVPNHHIHRTETQIPPRFKFRPLNPSRPDI
jgi:hypothetical protein